MRKKCTSCAVNREINCFGVDSGSPDGCVCQCKLCRAHYAMFSRCQDKSTHVIKRIKVCVEWQDRMTFIRWAESHGWQPGLHLDRIDNSGDYSPENCRFVTCCDNIRNGDRAKLAREQVILIRLLFASKHVSRTYLANLFKVSIAQINNVISKRSWSNV